MYHLALKIAEIECAQSFIVAISALLHDVWDHKLGFSDKDRALNIRALLSNCDETLNPDQMDQIVDIVNSVSFKKGQNHNVPESLEAKIVQDADRLDALGAVGIARTFAFGGAHNRPMYLHNMQGERTDSVGHFYEKLFLLKDRMNTETAKTIANERHRFMVDYMDQFYKEHQDVEL